MHVWQDAAAFEADVKLRWRDRWVKILAAAVTIIAIGLPLWLIGIGDEIAADPHRKAGDLVAHDGQRTVHPTLGPIEYELRGCRIRRASAPEMKPPTSTPRTDMMIGSISELRLSTTSSTPAS